MSSQARVQAGNENKGNDKNGNEKIRVALIYGGQSGEHSVSCLTAASVMKALDSCRYEIIPVGITSEGVWVPGHNDPSVLEAAGPHGHVEESPVHVMVEMGSRSELVYVGQDGEECDRKKIDVAFPLLHGSFGEDGTIQGLLEMAGIAYVGSGVFASAAGMDKHFMKVVLDEAGLPTVPYVLVRNNDWLTRKEEILTAVQERLVFPVFVKPARAGSSLGITKAENIDELASAIEVARAVDPKVLVEQGVTGREIECAVLGGHGTQRARASVLGEIALDLPEGAWYDYSTKYVATEGFHMEIPAKVDEKVAERMRELAVKVFEAFDCEGMTRVDFFLSADGSIYVNEHNTIPGFTEFSMYPILWAQTGIEYSALLDELISLACERPRGLR